MERLIEINTIIICLVHTEGEREMEEAREGEEEKERAALYKRWMKQQNEGREERVKERETFVWILLTDIYG